MTAARWAALAFILPALAFGIPTPLVILFREDAPALAALHPVNGVLLLVTTLVLGRLSWRGPQVVAPVATTGRL